MSADPSTPPSFQPEANELSSRSVPFRFSLRALFRLMTALAVVCGFGAVLPAAMNQIAIGALWIVASGWLITGIVFAKGDARAFCIGAAVVATSMWTGIGGGFAGGLRSLLRETLFLGSVSHVETWLIHMALAATAVGNGYLCIRARRYFERPSSPRDPKFSFTPK